jgi:hypothetical protein
MNQFAVTSGNPFDKAVTRESLTSGEEIQRFLACGSDTAQFYVGRETF